MPGPGPGFWIDALGAMTMVAASAGGPPSQVVETRCEADRGASPRNAVRRRIDSML